MSKEIIQINFSANEMDDVNTIVDNLAEVAAAYTFKNYGKHGLIEEVTLSDYNERNKKVKEAVLAFAASKAGLGEIKNTTDMLMAMDNTIFKSVFNTINTRVISTMMVRYECPQLDRIADIETVNAGESRSYEVDTKALPIAQRATYGSNVSMVPSYAMGSITVTPKPYTTGVSLDAIRIIANDYDYGKAIAIVYAGMVAAQYKLIVSKLFDTSILNGTPLYQANFAASTFTQLASDVGMLNGGSIDNVLALGTIPAWNAINALATQGGFATKDEYIRNGYLNKIYGVDSMILDQFTTFAAPFTSANAPSLRSIPNNLIVLVPVTGDKIVKLVRENYIRVIETPAIDNTLNRNEYNYFQNFDAAVATGSYFGLQGTQA